MNYQKELYQKRGKIFTVILLILFLLFAAAFLYDLVQITHIEATDFYATADNNLYLATMINAVLLIMTVGLWYLKKWAGWGFLITFAAAIFTITILEGFTSGDYVAVTLNGLLRVVVGSIMLWGMIIGRYWDKLG